MVAADHHTTNEEERETASHLAAPGSGVSGSVETVKPKEEAPLDERSPSSSWLGGTPPGT